MRVFDGFLFNGEFKMLNLRLNELHDVVDFHILVEADVTFSGIKKEPLFHISQVGEKFRHKIIYVLVTDSPVPNNAWRIESHHRNAIKRGLPSDITRQDILLVCDADEIPHPKGIQYLKTISPLETIWTFCMDLYYYDFFHKKKYQWLKARAIQASSNILPQDARDSLTGVIVPGHGGWHLSYFMDAQTISNKIRSFSHQEFNHPRFNDVEKIQRRMKNDQDLFDRGERENFIIDQDTSELPVHKYLLS